MNFPYGLTAVSFIDLQNPYSQSKMDTPQMDSYIQPRTLTNMDMKLKFSSNHSLGFWHSFRKWLSRIIHVSWIQCNDDSWWCGIWRKGKLSNCSSESVLQIFDWQIWNNVKFSRSALSRLLAQLSNRTVSSSSNFFSHRRLVVKIKMYTKGTGIPRIFDFKKGFVFLSLLLGNSF